MSKLDRLENTRNAAPEYWAVKLLSQDTPFPIAHHLPTLIWTMDENWALDYANPAWYQYTGLNPAQVKALDWKAIVHPADFDSYLEQWRSSVRTGQDLEAQFRLRNAKGKYRWYQAHMTRIVKGDLRMWIASLFDIQAQKDGEAALYESEQRFRTMADTAPVLLWLADAGKLRIYFNTRWLRFTGRTVEQEQGNGWMSSIHPDDLQHYLDIYMSAVDRREEFQIEYRLKRADGEYRWMLEVGIPRFTIGHAFAGYIGSCIDIHDRRRAEDEMHRSRNQLEAIFQGVGDGIIVQDAEDRIIYANEAAARMAGYVTVDELKSQPMTQVLQQFELVDESGRASSLSPAVKLPGELALRGIKGREITLRLSHGQHHRLRAGEEQWAVLSATPIFDEEGHVQFAVNILQDITHQRLTQQALEFLADATADINASLDYGKALQDLAQRIVPFLADWCAVDMLREGGTIKRMAVAHPDPEKAAIIRRLWDGIGSYQDPITKVIRTGEPLIMREITPQMIAQDVDNPELRDLLLSLGMTSVMLVPLKARGKSFGCIFFARTGQRHHYTREEFLFAQELANRAALAVDNAVLYRRSQDALAVRDDFLSIASHELKTPVTSIKAFLQALEKRMERPQSFDFAKNREYMQLSVRQVDRLAAIVSDLLDINRINQGRLEYNFKSVPIGPAVAEVVERMSVSFPDHRIVLKLQNLTARAKLDELRFEQVLTNLITNAVKYSPKDTDTEIFMYAQDGRIMIEIKDRGMGIAPEDQKYIFDRYYRTQDAIKSKASGMGVGLFIADQIIKAHGGKLSVHSNVGQGSTFIIELPRDDARGDHDARDSGTRDGDVRDGGAPSGAGSAPDDMPGDLPGGVPDDTSGDTSGGVSDKALGGISGGLSGGAGGGG